MDLATQAKEIWFAARSGSTALDSEGAVRDLTRLLESIKESYDQDMQFSQQKTDQALSDVEEQKSIIRKLVKLVRRGYSAARGVSHCPVCCVGEGQKHLPNCWLRHVSHQVWKGLSDSDWDKFVTKYIDQVSEVSVSDL